MALAARPHNLISMPMLMAGTDIGFGIDVHGIHIISLGGAVQMATRSGTLSDGLAKIQAARVSSSLFKRWDRTMLHPSIAHATMFAHDFVSRLDRSGRLQRIQTHNMQASVTALLCAHEQQRDFARVIAVRPSNIFGPISSHRITQVLAAARKARRATRPVPAVGSSA